MAGVEHLFATGGALDRAIEAYRPRREQIEMARAVEGVLEGGHAVLEAGTGIGKTFAYLVPIIQSGLSALISTGTRNLQDQLVEKDIPLLAKALNRPVNVAVLKGRANYLCRLAMDEGPATLIPESNEQKHWRAILDYAPRTRDGDIRGIVDVPQNAAIWERVTSTRDSCPVASCPYYNDCFLYKARARAHRTDIVIVNHHLFLSDLRLRDEGVAELLPSRDILLFDEAHLLPQLSSRYFGESLSTARLLRWLKVVEKTCSATLEDSSVIIALIRRLREKIGDWMAVTAAWENTRQPPAVANRHPGWQKALNGVAALMPALTDALTKEAATDEKLARLAQQADTDRRFLEQWENFSDDDIGSDEAKVRWLEKRRENLTLSIAPLSGRSIFERQWEDAKTVIFTSATLSVADDFSDFCEEVGVSTETVHRWDSPYDFAHRALLYLPKNLPMPNEQGHTSATVKAALPLIQANGGRAFLLFSTLRAMEEATTLLRLSMADSGLTVLKQGDAPNDELLRQFRQEEGVVLVGSLSFWQGVDVKGSALSLVVVDKVPFAPPTDPVLAARDEWRKKCGENPFLRNQLPPAVILMKQVAGRLMRDYDDYGVFVITDNRLRKRGYGKAVLSSLPPMKRSHDEAEAVSFLQRHHAQQSVPCPS